MPFGRMTARIIRLHRMKAVMSLTSAPLQETALSGVEAITVPMTTVETNIPAPVKEPRAIL